MTVDYYQCPICFPVVSVFDCKHKERKGVRAQLEQRIKRFEAIGMLRCKGSKSEKAKIWKIIDELGDY